MNGRSGGEPSWRRLRATLLVALPLACGLAWFTVVREKGRASPVLSETSNGEHARDAHGAAQEHASRDATRRRRRGEAGPVHLKRDDALPDRATATALPIPTSGAAPLASGTLEAEQHAERGGGRERELPWRLPRQCKSETPHERATRSLYLSRFEATPVWQSVVYAHADAPAEAIAVVTRDLEATHRAAVAELGLTARPAEVYVHPNVESMRDNSCAKADALAYYDGAIHLAPAPPAKKPLPLSRFERELQTSLKHEYIHHVLINNGIGRPIWLQEALAMKFADEFALDSEWRAHPLPLADMAVLLPSRAPAEVERGFYAQAAAMLFVLERLCTGLENCERRQIVEALKQGRAMPEKLFEWMIEQRAKDLLRTTPEAFWLDYVARHDLSVEMQLGLSARSRARQ